LFSFFDFSFVKTILLFSVQHVTRRIPHLLFLNLKQKHINGISGDVQLLEAARPATKGGNHSGRHLGCRRRRYCSLACSGLVRFIFLFFVF
jgi:hypothetical protein